MRIITFKIDPELLEKLDLQAQREGSTRSEIIRKALIMYLSRAERAPRPKIRIIE